MKRGREGEGEREREGEGEREREGEGEREREGEGEREREGEGWRIGRESLQEALLFFLFYCPVVGLPMHPT